MGRFGSALALALALVVGTPFTGDPPFGNCRVPKLGEPNGC